MKLITELLALQTES